MKMKLFPMILFTSLLVVIASAVQTIRVTNNRIQMTSGRIQFGPTSELLTSYTGTIAPMESPGGSATAEIKNLFDISTSYSVSFWLFPEAYDGTNPENYDVLFRANDGWYPVMQLDPYGGPINNLLFTDDGGTTFVNTTAPPLDQWTHIVFTSDSINAGQIIYINGSFAASNNHIGATSVGPGTCRLFNDGYGGDTLAYPRAPYAMMCEFAMWTNVLTQTDVTTLYNSGHIPIASLSVSPWNNGFLRMALHLIDMSSSIDTDITGSGFDATLVEGMTWGNIAAP